MTIAIGKTEEKRGWFDLVDDWLRRDRFVFVGWYVLVVCAPYHEMMRDSCMVLACCCYFVVVDIVVEEIGIEEIGIEEKEVVVVVVDQKSMFSVVFHIHQK